MNEQFDAQPCSNASIVAVLPNNKRITFLLDPETTAEDFINLLKANEEIEDSEEYKFFIICSGKILRDNDKFSNITNSDYILVYVISQKSSDTDSHSENTDLNQDNQYNNDRNNNGMETIYSNTDLLFMQQYFNFPLLPFAFHRRMDDENPILNNEDEQGNQQNSPFFSASHFVILILYFIIGFILGSKAIFIICFLFIFSFPNFSIVSSLLKGLIARFIWNFTAHFIF